jgi:hypothetical protein
LGGNTKDHAEATPQVLDAVSPELEWFPAIENRGEGVFVVLYAQTISGWRGEVLGIARRYEPRPPTPTTGQAAEAVALRAPTLGRFTEGFDTADLKEAKTLLDKLTEPAIAAEGE